MENSFINEQVKRLVEEIRIEENMVRETRGLVYTCLTEEAKERHIGEARMYEESIKRKIQLLSILKG